MVNRIEKLSLLSEMIAFAKTEDILTTVEYNFLSGVATQLDISQEDFNYLINNPVSYIPLKSHSERIVQFHRLILLLNISKNITKTKLVKIHNFGLRMGLNHDAINKVLDLMNSFPNNIVPPDVLIDIFKTQYN